MFENPEVLALVGAIAIALVGVVVGAAKFIVLRVDALVKASETKVDDKIWGATKAGLREALAELAVEARAELDAKK